MASITKKMVHGHPYYYARECKRVGGKPKIVWQKYLGRLEDIVAAVDEQKKGKKGYPVPQPDRSLTVGDIRGAESPCATTTRLHTLFFCSATGETFRPN